MLTAPDGKAASLALDVWPRITPKEARFRMERMREHLARSGRPVIVGAYLSEAVRHQLRTFDVGYLDLTGNRWLVLTTPGLFIETQGAAKDPDRTERPARSLRGPQAGRVVRTLVDLRPPLSGGRIASLARVDAGYVSRVLTFLDSEALITRGHRGRVEFVDWRALLRRWAQDAPLESRATANTYVAPRGIPELLQRVAALREESYTIT